MMKKSTRIDMLRHDYSMGCCGETYGPTPGSIPDATFICRHCRKTMKPVQREVRTLEECELIDRHRERFADEACAECGDKNNHHVVYDAELDAYFLRCGYCGDELREIEAKELKS